MAMNNLIFLMGFKKFILAGVAIAAFLLLLRTRSVSGTTAGSVGNDVMIALVLGGMPLSGGVPGAFYKRDAERGGDDFKRSKRDVGWKRPRSDQRFYERTF